MTTPAVGAFYVRSWGYDQTNINFYKVIEVTASGKSVRLQEWGSRLVSEAGGPSESVVPGDGPRRVHQRINSDHLEVDAPLTLHRLRPDSDYIRINDYDIAKVWDGTPQYRTGAGWGH